MTMDQPNYCKQQTTLIYTAMQFCSCTGLAALISFFQIKTTFTRPKNSKNKRLDPVLQMASLQSSRTQCCCCAIGVFAAMFGVFMLSAGICIVVNVGMEVDTSGLPSNLHNDDGRKIVGIILICVAVATLALSASVGFFYFVVCNRKPQQHPSPAARGGGGRPGLVAAGTGDSQHGKHRHHGPHHHHGSASRSVNGVLQQQHRTAGASSPAGGRAARVSQPERTRSRDSVRSGSQQSLRSAVTGAVDGPGGGSSRPSGRPSGSRYHGKRSHHKSRVIRYRSGLEPHQEEDVEAAKSVVDLKRTLSHGSDSKRGQSGQAWEGDSNTGDAELEKTRSWRNPPSIVLSGDMESQHKLETTGDSFSTFNNSNTNLETQLVMESGTLSMLGDTFNSTADLASQESTLNEDYHQQCLSRGGSEPDELQGPTTGTVYGVKSSFPPEQLPGPQDMTIPVLSQYTQAAPQQSSFAAANQSVSSISSASSVSVSSHSSTLHIAGEGSASLLIEPSVSTEDRHLSQHQPDTQQTFSSRDVDEEDPNTVHSSERRHRKHKRHHRRSHREKISEHTDTDIQLNQLHTQQSARHDPIPDVRSLPSTSPDQSITALPEGSVGGSDQSRDNRAFSYDGGDPDLEESADLRQMQEYMKELMEESEDV